jgi:hypothetical protein
MSLDLTCWLSMYWVSGSNRVQARPGPLLANPLARSASCGSGLSCHAGGPRLAYPTRQEGRGPVIREELARLFTWQERHRRLAARLIIAFVLTLVVLAAGSVLIWIFESGKQGGQIHGFGDAVFFTAVQLLTISSSITNPVTAAGKVVDVALEMWAIFVVTAIAGSFASFFSSGDSS